MPEPKRLERGDIAALGLALRAKGRRVVHTNGCFDLLHVGHLRYLRAARKLGDVLVVSVNSDAGVRKLKGPSRPVVPEDERAELLAGLECVDYVTIFDEPTPEEVIRLLRPDLHVKGGDYDAGALPEAAAVHAGGGEIRILPFVPGKSTTGLLAQLARPEGPDPQ